MPGHGDEHPTGEAAVTAPGYLPHMRRSGVEQQSPQPQRLPVRNETLINLYE